MTVQNYLDAFTYPFKDPNGMLKILIGSVLMAVYGGIQYVAYIFLPDMPFFALFIWGVTLIPIIHVEGYVYWLYQDLIMNNEEKEMPFWEDWRDMFSSGVKLQIIELIFSLPSLACIVYMIRGPFQIITKAIETAPVSNYSIPKFSNPFGLLISLLIPISLNLVFSLVSLILKPPAVTNMVANDHLKAAFKWQRIWVIFKQNPWNFILPGLLLYALMAFVNAGLFMFFGSCFILGMIILSGFTSFYFKLIATCLYSRAYRNNVNLIKP